MGMADSTGKGIGGVCRRLAGEAQQPSYHFLYLFFAGVAFTDHRLLDLQRRILCNGQIIQHCRAYRRSARLPEHQGGFGIDIDKHLLDRDVIRLVLCDDFVEVIHDGFEAQRQLTLNCPDAATADVDQFAAGLVDDSKTG
jgi:hypothetical protein